MADSIDTIKNSYPLPVYNYRVEIDGETVAFSEVSGFDIAYETTTFKESQTESGLRGPRILHMPSQPTTTTLSLKKGVVRGGVSVGALYNWIQTVQINQVVKKDIYVRLCDEKGNPVISWKIINAFPTKLDAPTFDANSNDVAIETMELTADSVFIEEA
ncbi:MAG: phage tail protein [Bacteroidota bacterium]